VFVNSVTGGRVFLLCLTACLGCAWAQSDESAEAKRPETREDTHILGIVPDYDTVRNSSGVIMPISARRKFWLATEDVFDPFSFLITGFYAAGSQLGNQYPEFGQGAKGYAKRYAGAFADNAVGNYMTEGLFPVMLHQDPRYFRMGTKYGFWKRVGYSASRVIVTRGDSGARQFNFSEIVGNASAAAVSSAYYTPSSRNTHAVLDKWALNVRGRRRPTFRGRSHRRRRPLNSTAGELRSGPASRDRPRRTGSARSQGLGRPKKDLLHT
jgi:hypothetical protein